MFLATVLSRGVCAAALLAAGAAVAQAPIASSAPFAPSAPPPLPRPAGAALGVAPMEWHFGELLARFAPFDIAGQHLGFVSSELGGRVVQGAPYSAEAINESVQVLADGNRIVRKTSTRLARDGEGRTRQERVAADGQVSSVFINDPVSGKRWMLHPSRKTVSELRTPTPGAAPPAGASAEELRSWADQMRDWARDVGNRFRSEETRTEQTANGSNVTRVVRSDGTTREIEVRVVRVGDPNAPLPPAPPPPAPPGTPSASAVPSVAPVPPVPPAPMIAPLPTLPPPGEGVTTALGSKSLDGVRADGTRTSWTIPAGRIGNEKPIEIVSERWYSPDLMLVVASSHRDPRSGETNYRLTSLKRGEPDAALFTVPVDYQPRERRGERK
jgi:hypothetical protein